MVQFECPKPSTLARSKERKGSNFAIWQHCSQSRNFSELQERFHGAALMAPAVYWKNAEDGLVLVSYLIDLLEDIYEDLGKILIFSSENLVTAIPFLTNRELA